MLDKFGIEHLSAGTPTANQEKSESSSSELIANVRLTMIGGLHIMGLKVYRRVKDGETQVYLIVPKTPENAQGKSTDYVGVPEEMQLAIIAEVLKREAKNELWTDERFNRDTKEDSNPIPFERPFHKFNAFSVERVREWLREQLAETAGR